MKSNQENWLYIYLSLYYSRLNNIEQDCQQNKIPQDLIPMKEFQEDLIDLNKSLKEKKPYPGDSISKAYQLYNPSTYSTST